MIREQYPVLKGKDSVDENGKTKAGNEFSIPFNSAIKFNLLIRDMNKDEPNPRNAEDNIVVYLKGAPERVLNRVSKVLVKNAHGQIVEEEYDDNKRIDCEAANQRYGNNGERVLAFARTLLDPNDYKKTGPQAY